MPERRRGIVPVVVGVVIVAALVLLLAPPARQVSADHRLSTLRTTPDGAGALYELLQRLEVPVTRRMAPLTGLDDGHEALALLRPTEPLSPAELDSVQAWVARGGRLFAALSYRDRLLVRLGLRVEWPLGRPRDASEAAADEGRLPMARPSPHAWTTGIDSIGPVAWTLEITDDSPVTAVEPLLVTDSSELVAFRARLGDGIVVVLSDPALLSNGRIRSAGAAPLLARAGAELAQGAPLVFDEYHHGHRGGSPTGAFFGFLFTRPAGWVVLHLALVALLAMLPAAARLGSPVPAAPVPRRSPLEHVAALGEVYRQARAADIARRRLIVGFARRLGRERPPPGAEAAFLERVGRGAPAAASAVAAVAHGWREKIPVRELAARIDEALTRLTRAE